MNNTKYTIGINFLHSDSSACIFTDDKLIAAVEEERFTRSKHTSKFPINSIKFCLEEANISISDVNFVTINTNPYSSLLKKSLFTITNLSSIRVALRSILNTTKKFKIIDHLNDVEKNNTFNGEIKYVDHHTSHIASSLYFSEFDKCANISVDGFGDFASTSWGFYDKGKLKIKKKIHFPHSLGIFYQSLTQFLGFKSYGDEYKLMGLSSYGDAKYCEELSKIIKKTKNGFELNLKYFLHHKEKIFDINEHGQFIYKNLYTKKIQETFGNERKTNEKINQFHLDLAKSVQETYEDIFFHLLNIVYKEFKVDNLTISGGCAMNSVANGKIKSNSEFKNIYISPNPGDGGGSVGSASYFLNTEFNYHLKVNNYAYLGSQFNNKNIKKIIDLKKLDTNNFKLAFIDKSKIYSKTAELIIQEKVVGWFQGKMEWGPRALGNRSILADARNPNIKELINSKIKRRESFRPFAPSILKNYLLDWFEADCNVPYMSEVYLIKSAKRKLIPGVTHVDGTGRLQTVTAQNNLDYFNLINKFYEITNVPLILNTSFNENEPIVNRPEEAIDCFLRTNMDALVLENWVIERNT